MRYYQNINQVKCIEWGLNFNQGALFDLLNQMHSWAKPHVIGDEVYYWVSRNKVIDEIPLAYEKADTVYRAFKTLAEKGLIIYKKEGQKDLIQLTEKGKTWNAKITKNDTKNNSETNPNDEKICQKLGNKSDKTRKYFRKNSEINPTYKNTNNKNYKDKRERGNTPTETKKFIKPTLEQVEQYFIEREHPSPVNEAERWFDYYTANGWKVGRNPMKDWKATIRNWIRKDTTTGNQNANNQPTHSQPSHFDDLRQQARAKYGNPQPTSDMRTVN